MLILDKGVLGFCIYGTGLMKCWLYEDFDMELLEPQYGYLPIDGNEEQYYYDLSHDLHLPYEHANIVDCIVDPTDGWSFSLRDFDETKVVKPVELPNILNFKLSNGTEIKLATDEIEYFNIFLDKWNISEKGKEEAETV